MMNRRRYLASLPIGLAGCLDRDSETEGSRIGTTVRRKRFLGPDSVETENPPQETDIFDDFSDISRWKVYSGSLGTIRENGSQLAVLEAGPTDDRVAISYRLSEPIDCSEVVPGLATAANQPATPTIHLFDTTGDRVDVRRGIKPGRQLRRYSFGLTKVVGEPDLSKVAEVGISLWAGNQSKGIRVDDIHLSPRPSTGKVMIQFDDGIQTDYTEGFPILDRYDYPAVTFVNPGRIGSENRLSIKQCEQLQDAGWAIGNHTATHAHLEDLTRDEQAREIVGAKEWLLDHGFEQGARYFAYPFGEWNEHTLELVDRYQDMAFWAGRGVQGYPANALLCPRVGEPEAKTATELLDRAARWGGHVTLFYHELSGRQLADFERTIRHIKALDNAGRIDVVMPSDLECDAV